MNDRAPSSGGPRRRLEGIAEVEAALVNGTPLTTLLLPKGPLPDTLARLQQRAIERDVPIWQASEGDLRRMSSHSGTPAPVLACAGPPMTADLHALLERPGAVWLMQRPSYASNVGFAIRTAEVSGAEALVVDSPSFNHADRSRAGHVSMGADHLLPVVYAQTPQVLDAAAARGRPLIAIEDSGPLAPWQVDLTGPVLLMVGSERAGLDDQTLARADHVIRLPMPGFVPSYNLQAALASIATERLRQLSQRALPPTGQR